MPNTPGNPEDSRGCEACCTPLGQPAMFFLRSGELGVPGMRLAAQRLALHDNKQEPALAVLALACVFAAHAAKIWWTMYV